MLDSLERARANDTVQSGSSGVSEVQAAENTEEDSLTEEDTLPSSDEIEREELKGVFVIRDGTARFVEIKTGIADQKNIEVTSGLAKGDSVISGPYRVLRNVKDGDAVKIEKKNKKKE